MTVLGLPSMAVVMQHMSLGSPAIFPLGLQDTTFDIDPSDGSLGIRVADTGASLPDVAGFDHLTSRRVYAGSNTWIEFRIGGEIMTEDAYQLASMVLHLLVDERTSLSTAVRASLERLQELLARRGGTSLSVEVGLWGELLVLQRLIPTLGPPGAMQAWQGPRGGRTRLHARSRGPRGQDHQLGAPPASRRPSHSARAGRGSPAVARLHADHPLDWARITDPVGADRGHPAPVGPRPRSARHHPGGSSASTVDRWSLVGTVASAQRTGPLPCHRRVPGPDTDGSERGGVRHRTVDFGATTDRPGRMAGLPDRSRFLAEGPLAAEEGLLMIDEAEDCFLAALKAIESRPRPLLRRAEVEADDRGVDIGIDDLRYLLTSTVRGQDLRTRLHLRLGVWDGLESAAWTDGTGARTDERRRLIYKEVGLTSLSGLLDTSMPVHGSTTVVIDAGSVTPWYPSAELAKREFYWPHYRDLLQSRGWSAEALTSLDEATTRVVERIAPPASLERYSARGLVVGNVQSGKTANFTGSIAKAIDAGYRLIIVLTGTIEILRQQTQRRLDQELVGVENITNGLEPDHQSLIGQVEYLDDPAWQAGNWLRHGVRPSVHGFPDIIRLTTRDDDYRGLAQGITTLELKKADKSRPLHDPVNLYASNALIAVVKKQTHRLDALLKDLNRVSNQLQEIPALILDDESDQASINTSDPRKWQEGQPERTSINHRISALLRILPRGQYIGYTATPFANVFIDPGDGEDLFPRDFLLSLTPPDGYMGIAAFHDEDQAVPVHERSYADSSQRSHVRDLLGITQGDRDLELAGALDAFVLTGAVKLYREAQLQQQDMFRHHTMLVHESVRQKEHGELAKRIQELWDDAEFTSSTGLQRLRRLWEGDFEPVSLARSEGYPLPSSFDDLKTHIAETITRVCGAGGKPYIIVNGDQDVEREKIAFNERSVWRILIGGTSLSRGFTVEGLTISYYRRRTSAGDTTMQMGRWFGYRRGYRDLVRLYIGRREPGPRDSSIDLYDTFAGLMRDEEDFRKELARYAKKVEGSDEFKLTPREIPPLVSQHLPQLPPTSRNKMYNAELEIRRFPGEGHEPHAWPYDGKDIEYNYRCLTPLISSADRRLTDPDAGVGQQQYLHSVVPHLTMVETLRQLRWLYARSWRPELAYFEELLETSRLREWLLLLPQSQKEGRAIDLPDIGPRTVYKRKRRGGERKGVFGFISTSAHRSHVQHLAESCVDSRPDRGIALFYPVHTEETVPTTRDLGRRHITFAPYFLIPQGAMPSGGALVRFRVRDAKRADQPIIDAPS